MIQRRMISISVALSGSRGGGGMKRATVIIRSKNSAWVIGQALTSLFSQRFTDFDVLVVDEVGRLTRRGVDVLAASEPAMLEALDRLRFDRFFRPDELDPLCDPQEPLLELLFERRERDWSSRSIIESRTPGRTPFPPTLSSNSASTALTEAGVTPAKSRVAGRRRSDGES